MISKNPPIKLGKVLAATIKNMSFGGREFPSSVMTQMMIAAIQNTQPPIMDSCAID